MDIRSKEARLRDTVDAVPLLENWDARMKGIHRAIVMSDLNLSIRVMCLVLCELGYG